MSNSNKLLNFIITSSLYDEYTIEDNPELNELVQICNKKIRFEMFCPGCGEKKVFIYEGGLSKPLIRNIENALQSPGNLTVAKCIAQDLLKDIDHIYFRFNCSLDESHKLEYFFTKKGYKIIKVGQYPSSADIDLPQAKKFSSILGKQYYDELKRAIGLYSHGVGIGSFVYLRRIIEKLVYDAFKEAQQIGKLTEEQFEYRKNKDGDNVRNGMEEKIKLLNGFLPDLITEHPKIYSVVSKGIHELSEDECRKYFPVLKDGIVMILDDIATKKEKERAELEYKKSLGNILYELN